MLNTGGPLALEMPEHDEHSKRHFFVIRRASAHLLELNDFITSVISNLPLANITLCHHGFMKNKILLMEMTVEELEQRTSAEARAQVMDELEKVEKDLLFKKAGWDCSDGTVVCYLCSFSTTLLFAPEIGDSVGKASTKKKGGYSSFGVTWRSMTLNESFRMFPPNTLNNKD